MMRSLFSGVSGLKSHQTRMDVIGNNIANVNTIGFKSSRVTFADTLYQTQTGASAPTSTVGGTNPKQIGLGVGVASIDLTPRRRRRARTPISRFRATASSSFQRTRPAKTSTIRVPERSLLTQITIMSSLARGITSLAGTPMKTGRFPR